VLGAAEACWALTAAVGALVSDIEDFRLQYQLARDIAKLQRNGCRYFDLPAVAVLDDLGPLAEVLGATPGRELVPFVERILGRGEPGRAGHQLTTADRTHSFDTERIIVPAPLSAFRPGRALRPAGNRIGQAGERAQL
jgi:hypothetical protein